jgi:hypothetical protein
MADKTPEEIAADKAAKAARRARVLHDHDGFAINSIVSGEDATRGVAEGWADGHPSAVKYAEKLARLAKRAAGEDDD